MILQSVLEYLKYVYIEQFFFMLYHFSIAKALSATCILFIVFFLMIQFCILGLHTLFSAFLLSELTVRNSPAIIVFLYRANLRLWNS